MRMKKSFFLFLAVSMIFIPSILYAQTFQWPLYPFETTPTITQDYACKGTTPSGFDSCVKDDKYHTGLDMTSTSSDQTVYVAGAGTVCFTQINDGADRGFGNAVIIDHGNNIYSLYAHLESPTTKAVGQFINIGEPLGTMGGTGNGGIIYGTHLHFEIKRSCVLGDKDNLNPGYSPIPPDVAGYYDPWKYISSTAITPIPMKVVNSSGVNVRRGSSTIYSAFTTLNSDQGFVAFAKSGDWYRIYLPCDNNSSCAGWIVGTYSGITYSVEDLSATQVEIKNTGTVGLFVRPSPESSSSLDKVWDEQRFVTFGTPQSGLNCSNNWYQIYLPAISGALSGWICGDFLNVTAPCSTPGSPSNPSPTDVATGQATSLTLGWSSTANTDSYDVYFGTSSNPPYVGNATSATYPVSGLSYNTTYYWKIVAKNNCGNSTSGTVCSFTTSNGTMPGPNIGDIAKVPMLTNPSQIAIEQGGTTALVTDGNYLSRVVLSTGAVTTIASGLISPTDIKIESNGISALITQNDATGRLIRVNLLDGSIISVASGFVEPRGVAIESSGNTALVIDQRNSGTLSRVNLSTGEITTIASGFAYTPLNALAIESEGQSALVVHGFFYGGALSRVNLNTGTITTISSYTSVGPTGVAVESNGSTALVLSAISYGPRQVQRVDLSTGSSTVVYSTGTPGIGSYSLGDIAIETGGASALIPGGMGETAIYRLDLTTKQMSIVAYGLQPQGIAIEANRATALVTGTGGIGIGALFRVNLSSGVVQRVVGFGFGNTYSVAIEGSGSTALVIHNGFTSVLNRVNLTTGSTSTITSDLNSPIGIAIESGGTTGLVTERGTSNALSRVDLTSGAVTRIVNGLSNPGGIAVEPGNITAIVTQSSSLSRSNLNTGASTTIASITGSRSVAIEPGGCTALVTASNGLYRVNLSTGDVTTIVSFWPSLPIEVAIESGGSTALVTTSSGIFRVRISGEQTTNTHTLTIIKSGSGSGNVISNTGTLNWCGNTGMTTYDSGISVTLTATPDTGSIFTGWSGDADCSDGQVTMDTDKTCTANFAGTPNISSSPTSLNFGNVNVGVTSASQTVTVTNTGTANLSISTAALTDANSSEYIKQVDTCSGNTLPPSDNCNVQIAFTPASAGAKTAGLAITSNDPDTPTLNIPLSGSGVQQSTQQPEEPMSVVLSCPTNVTAGNALTVTVKLYNYDCANSISVNRLMAQLMGNSSGTLLGLGIWGPYNKSISTKTVPAATCDGYGNVTTPGTVTPFSITIINPVPTSLSGKMAEVTVDAITSKGDTLGNGSCMVNITGTQ